MGMPQDAEVLARSTGLSARRRAPFVAGATLLELTMTRRLEYGDRRVMVRQTTPTGNRISDRVLTTIAERRFAPKVDKALALAWLLLEPGVEEFEGDVRRIRDRIRAAMADRRTPPGERAFAALAVAGGILPHPDFSRRRSAEAALLVLGPQTPRTAPLLKATIAEVGTQMSSLVTTPTTGEMYRMVRGSVGRRVGGTAGLARLVEPLRAQLDEPTIGDTVGLDLIKGADTAADTRVLPIPEAARRDSARAGRWAGRGEVALDGRQWHHQPGPAGRGDPADG